MIVRPFTCFCLLLAAGSGLYLYQTKNRSQMLDREIARTLIAADAARQRTGLLKAEYALLNDPSRLADLTGQLLPALKNTAPGQFSTWTDLDKRLPAVGAAPPPAPLEPDAPLATLPTPKPEPARPEAAKPDTVKPEVAKPDTVKVEPKPEPPRAQLLLTQQHLAMPAPPPVQPAAPPHPPTPLHPAPVQVARTNPPPPIAPAPVAAAPTPVPVAHSRVQVARVDPPPPATPAEAIARIARGGPVDPSVPAVASALGMARAMMTAPSPISPVYVAQPTASVR